MHVPLLLIVCAFLLAICLNADGVMAAEPAVRETDGVTVRLPDGTLRLMVYNDAVIRAIFSPSNQVPATSLVITAKPQGANITVHEDDAAVTLATRRVQARVDRVSGSVTFLDATGSTILRELPGGRSMKPAVVNHEQSFRPELAFIAPQDESLYGIAGVQDGTWDWRGLPAELLQVNTEAALPMMVSSKGYGLLWDNASLTWFNPIDQQVSLDEKGAGTFTTSEAGEYVFFLKDHDRKNHIGIKVDGKTLVEIQNMWVPYSVRAKVTLPANTTCRVERIGPGTLWARKISDTTTFRSEIGDVIDYTFFYGPSMADVIAQYRNITGAAPLWPKWAYGFWQCRERYSSQQQLVDAAKEFRKRQIPLDLIVQDWQYWGKYGWSACRFDETHYPDPAGMIRELHDMNIKFMISVWHNNAGDVDKELRAINGKVGDWCDVTNPKARDIRWAHMKSTFFDIGTDAWWQDATEPGDEGTAFTNSKCLAGSTNRLRNAYPLLANQGVYENQRAASSEKRVVTLSRSAYPGQQRYGAAQWSGDIAATWETFRRQIPLGLNFAMAGLPYWTTDTGGFFRPGTWGGPKGNQYKSEDYHELLIRWFQFSTFCPILRIHGWTSETEMWKYGPVVERNLKRYDELRYRLLPYIYSLAWQVTSNGDSFMRPLVVDFPGEPKVREINDEYMFGPAFMVAPMAERGVERNVYLPAGPRWYDFWTGKVYEGGQSLLAAAPLEQIPLFVRAGSILPLGRVMQYATEKPADEIELRVYAGADGAFTLYEDENDNYNYEKGAHATVKFRWNDATRTLSIGKREGSFPGMLNERTFKVVLVSETAGIGDQTSPTPTTIINYKGEELSAKL